jgi:RNA polymerase sigma-70 factor (ECF subfamily)
VSGRGPVSGQRDTWEDHDSVLIKGAVAGETRALATLLQSVRPTVYRWAAGRSGDLDDAEDITQQVMLRLCSGLHTFRGESRFSSWLYRITANEASSFFRSEAIRQRLSSELLLEERMLRTSHCEAGERIDRQRTHGMVRDIACALPPVQQAAFRLVDLDGMRPCEAARALGKSQANVRTSLCRARRKIRELVAQSGRRFLEELASKGHETPTWR